MDESQQQRIMRKPLGDISNVIRKPYNHSKIPGSSPASDSSIGSTPNPIHIHRPITSPSGHLVGDENQIVYDQRKDTTSKAKADVPFYKISIQETRNNVKERSAPLCSFTLDKVKYQGKVNQSCLDKTTHDGKRMSVVPRYSSMENVKDQRQAVDKPSSTHHMKNTTNKTGTPNTRSALKIKDRGNESADMAIAMLNTSMKRLDKGKAIAVLPDYPSMKNLRNKMMEVRVPLKGVVIKERGETVIDIRSVSGSSCADPGEKNKGKAVVTPISYRSLEKNDKRGSCPPLLRTTSNRNEADGVEDIIQFKPRTEPPPNKKKRRCSSKEEYALPQDYVEQQRAYFKEIDDFELEVEEV